MTDETERFTPPRPAIPVARTKQRVADAEANQMNSPENRAAGKQIAEMTRSLRAKKAWQTRRAHATVKSTPKRKAGKSPLLAAPYGSDPYKQLADHHRTATFTVQEAVELARLMVDYPFLRRLVE
jgi:hypothetical protein